MARELPLSITNCIDNQLRTYADEPIEKEEEMSKELNRAGKVKYALLGWLIGLPLPIVIILLFVRGCDF